MTRRAYKRTRPIKLDADQLEAARQGGLLHTTLDEIAFKLGVSPSSLDNWLTNEAHPFTKAYRTGRADANAVVQKGLLNSAAHGNVQAICRLIRRAIIFVPLQDFLTWLSWNVRSKQLWDLMRVVHVLHVHFLQCTAQTGDRLAERLYCDRPL